ncbi:MAG: hypothetical protein A2289_25165 [Deltaproteobacteria bacterium RIFOXYA12_FULL_58_15]|nr:MAG: hypothetical protein A2289_25165 [Deltaproteobacteria bacterium RIFOXYA12_FULL_58_15]OGR13303.1 MAG: hypothetical protein A2341_16215 [Deltaproteobacteria bacterium RIFOXYB12_FULL_58_9]
MGELWITTASIRLDRLLRQRLSGFTAGAVRALIRSGRVSVNGTRVVRHRTLRKDDKVVVDLPAFEAERLPCPNPDIPLSIERESTSYIVVNKSAPLPCLPAFPGDHHCLACALVARYPELRNIGRNRECGLLHRLDNETSGLLLVAKTHAAFGHLLDQQETGAIEKGYITLVHGRLEGEGNIDLPIAHAPGRQNRMVTADSTAEAKRLHARPATTRYRAREARDGFTLLEVEISRGARHQIRAHLAAIGHPIAGDELYGPKTSRPTPRHFLHAHQLTFRAPENGERTCVNADLPAELEDWLKHC